MVTAAATRGDAAIEVDEFSPPSVDGDTGEKSDDERAEGGKNEAHAVSTTPILTERRRASPAEELAGEEGEDTKECAAARAPARMGPLLGGRLGIRARPEAAGRGPPQGGVA